MGADEFRDKADLLQPELRKNKDLLGHLTRKSSNIMAFRCGCKLQPVSGGSNMITKIFLSLKFSFFLCRPLI